MRLQVSAALAAASMLLKPDKPTLAKSWLTHAQQLHSWALEKQGEGRLEQLGRRRACRLPLAVKPCLQGQHFCPQHAYALPDLHRLQASIATACRSTCQSNRRGWFPAAGAITVHVAGQGLAGFSPHMLGCRLCPAALLHQPLRLSIHMLLS